MSHMRITALVCIAASTLMLGTACNKGPSREERQAAAAASAAAAAAAQKEAEAKEAAAVAAADARTRQGLLYANQGDFSNAINEFQAAIDTKPSARAYSNLGAAYMQTGKKNLAHQALQSAEELAPDDPLVLYNLTAYYSVVGDTDIAAIYLDKALTHGFANYDALRFDPDLENLRGEPDFRATLERHKVFIQ